MNDVAPGTAVVTGASTGIGREIARELAARAHDLVLVARSREGLETLASELSADHGVAARVVPADLSRPDAPRSVLRAVEAEEGRPVDVLVNNAGFGTYGPFAGTPLEESLAMIRLNVSALTALTHLLLAGMLERGRGRVLNVASTAAFQPGPHMAVYYATKAYVLHLSEALAEELRGSNVTVTCLCPGPTRTEFQRRAEMEESGLVADWTLMDAARVARAGVRGAERGKRLVLPGFANKAFAFATRLAPRRAVTRVVDAIQAPPDAD